MYLKSLILKGFKSFADRSVLEFEPGITAIVGPNGSGKSNISDAVLWVLGERSAKNLRGQAMEDVIFAGSSARKPVGVSEVELVLDNSDHTLPVDFTEVSIARRMYRNGESEYLINGSLVRRMDVLDILHDTGLGAGTHSIISQGSLDTILQSKPEDRRALIEEAAGVLKHKQRKMRSEGKLGQMDVHLARVKDVAAEIERQLRPLERKAKRAQAYEGLACELADLKLVLAVDDLRIVQKKWTQAGKKEEDLQIRLKEIEATIRAAETRMQHIQNDIQKRSLDAGDIAQQLRRASSVLERLESAKLFLSEKQAAALNYTKEMHLSLNSNALKISRAESAGREAHDRLEQTSQERMQAQTLMNDLSEQHSLLQGDVRILQGTIDECNRDEQKLAKEVERLRLEHNESIKAVSIKRTQEKLIEGRCSELKAHILRIKEELDAAAKLVSERATLCTKLVEKEQRAKESLAVSYAQREQLREDLEKTYGDCSNLAAQIKGIEELERHHERENPALSWVLENKTSFEQKINNLASMLEVSEELEELVERVLGDDLEALLVEDIDTADSIVSQLFKSGKKGEVSLLPRHKHARVGHIDAPLHSRALSNLISYPESCRPAVEMLLGKVIVCETREEAMREHANDSLGLCFATTKGLIIWPDSKLTVSRGFKEAEGVLARLRQLGQLRSSLSEKEAQSEILEESKLKLDKDLQQAQKRSLQASEDLARVRGDHKASESEYKRLKDSYDVSEKELEAAKEELVQARLILEEAQPVSQDIETFLAEKQGAQKACLQRKTEAINAIAPLRSRLKELEVQLTEARLKTGTLNEWESYAKRMLASAQEDENNLKKDIHEIKLNFTKKWVSSKRSEAICQVLEVLIGMLHIWVKQLEQKTNDTQSSSSGLHEALSVIRAQTRQSQDAYDEIQEQMSEMKVEKGRLELQVEVAIETIVEDCKTPLETALELGIPEDRSEIENSALRLERKIKNMGIINPDAALQYSELKKRYDYITSQLDDISSARTALDKILNVIDARMKDDFIKTFNEVNGHFKDVFSILFPGGSAELSLVDPDDLEHTGVEVSAQPRGKRITKMMLLSGGEKSLTALSLLFAMYRTKTTPFYILDEVEAALDDTNLRRLNAYFDKLRGSTQLILITHQRRTMEMADALYGTSMQADGVTRVVSQKLDRVSRPVEEKV